MGDEVVTTPFGKFLITPGEILGETARAGSLWDGAGFLQPIALEHGRLGERGQTILDVGANQGFYSVWLARQGAWRVVAVEPQEVVYQRLLANLDLNQDVCAGQVVPMKLAAYSHRTTMHAEPLDPGNWGGTALTPQPKGEVRAAPLDDFRFLFGDRVSLVKVDTQGCDARVLYGLGQVLRQDRPVVVFEWERELAKAHGDTLVELVEWLAELHYDTHEWPSHPGNYLALPEEG